MCSHAFRVADLDNDGKMKFFMDRLQLMTMEMNFGALEMDMETAYM